MKIAVLLTCFNRKEKTKICLQNLYYQELPDGMSVDVFLCDDGSTDGTGAMLREEFPQVNVCKGTGNFFWGGGMRMAWSHALATASFDYFLWLNDDTFLIPQAIQYIWKDYLDIGRPVVLTAACSIPGAKQQFSYGGHGSESPIFPNGKPQEVTFINGNVVLIPSLVVDKIGIISPVYTHYYGDFDFGLRAQKAGIPCFTTSAFYAECDQNQIPYWAGPALSIKERWKGMKSVKGLALEEYIYFKTYHYGRWVGFKSRVEVYLKVFNVKAYVKTRNLFHSLIRR